MSSKLRDIVQRMTDQMAEADRCDKDVQEAAKALVQFGGTFGKIPVAFTNFDGEHEPQMTIADKSCNLTEAEALAKHILGVLDT